MMLTYHISHENFFSTALSLFVGVPWLNHFDAHKIVADSQHAFRKRKSCETQLGLTRHHLTREIDKCGQVDMLVLDFAKAFDTVAH